MATVAGRDVAAPTADRQWWRRGRPRLIDAAATVMMLAGAATVAFTVHAVIRLHVRLPFWDEWQMVPLFRAIAEGQFRLGLLANQHNEHRLLVPRLFFIADARFAALSGWLNLATCCLLQAINAAILIALARKLIPRAAARGLMAGFILLMLFTLRQEQNFSSGFQLQFVGVFTAAAAASVAYAGALARPDGPRWRLFAAAALACLVATYTMANGVLAGPTLGVLAALRRAPWRVQAGTWALSAVLAALFFHGYVGGGSTYPPSVALTHLLAYPRFITAYLGNPLGETLRVTQALGLAGLALAAGAAWRVAAGRTRDPAGLALLGIAGFVVASAAATAWGRIANGTGQAFESRYATPSLLFWSAMAVFWFPVAAGSARRPVSVAAFGAVMALLAAAAVAAEVSAWPALAERSAALNRVSDSLISGLYDAEAAGTYENNSPEEVAPHVPFLREQHLAAFADPDAAALGRPLSALGRVAAAGGCTGSVAARADPGLGSGGLRLWGTASDVGARRAPRRIIVADAAGTVVGFGSAALPGEPSRRWSAYARGTGDAPLAAFARLADGTLCRIGAAG